MKINLPTWTKVLLIAAAFVITPAFAGGSWTPLDNFNTGSTVNTSIWNETGTGEDPTITPTINNQKMEFDLDQPHVTLMRTVAAETNISGIRAKISVSAVPAGSTWEAETGLILETNLYRAVGSVIYNGDDTYSILFDIVQISDDSIVYSMLLPTDAGNEEEIGVFFDGTNFWLAYFDGVSSTAETIATTSGNVSLTASAISDTAVFGWSDGGTSTMTGTVDDVQRFVSSAAPIGFTASASTVTVNEGSTANFTVSLASIQGSDVTITPSTVLFGDDDITISPSSITISAGSTGPATFTLTAASDSDWSNGSTIFELKLDDDSRVWVRAVEADTTHYHEWASYDDFSSGSIDAGKWSVLGIASQVNVSAGALTLGETNNNFNGVRMVQTANIWGVKADLTLNETAVTDNYTSNQIQLESQTHGATVSVSTEAEGTEIFCEIYSHNNYPTWTQQPTIIAEAGIGGTLGQTYNVSIQFDGVDFWIEIDGVPMINSRYAAGNAPSASPYFGTQMGLWFSGSTGDYTGIIDNVEIYQAKTPPAPVITGFTDDTGSSSSDTYTGDNTPTFTGTGLAYSTIELFDSAASIGTTSVGSGGTWILTPSTLADGGHSITAISTMIESSPASSAQALTTDTSSPSPVLSGPGSADASTPFDVTIDSDTDDNGATDLVISDITVTNGTATVFTPNGADSYTVQITPSGTGALTVSIAAAAYTDLAGNNNTVSNTYSVTVTSGPTVILSGISPTKNSPIAVMATFSDPVNGFTLGDIIVTNGSAGSFTGSDGDSIYNFTVTPAAEGTVTVSIPDAAATATTGGNDSVASSQDFEYDITGPTVSLSTSESDPTNSATFNVTVTFNESTSDFLVGDLTVGNGSASLTGSGTTYTATITPVADGSVTVDVASGVASDAASNTNSAATQLSIVYDGTAPAAPSVVSISSDTGDSTSDGVTSDDTISITGTAENNSTVTVNIDGSQIGTIAANGTGDWTYNHTGTTLAEATYAITATATDAATNVSSLSAAFDLVVDKTGPTFIDVGYISDDNGSSNIDEITNDQTLIIFGTSESGVTSVEVSLNSTPIGTTTTVNSGGDWEFDYTGTSLTDATYAVTAIAKDAAGNPSSASTATSIIIDTVAPTVTLTSPTTTDNLFTITATFNEAVDGLTSGEITVTNGAVSNLLGSGTTWTFNVTPVADGPVGVTLDAAAAQDVAGNNNTVSNTLNLTADTTNPGVLLTTPSPTISTTFTVTATFTKSVTGLTAGGIVVTNGTVANVAGSGATWTFEVTPIIDGLVTTTVNSGAAQDSVGNTNTISNVLNTTADVPPTVLLTTTLSSLVTTGPFVATATFSESVTGLVAGAITVTNGSASSLSGSGTTYTFTVTPGTFGNVDIVVPAGVAVDSGTNGNTASNSLTVVYSPVDDDDDDKWYEGCNMGNTSSYSLLYLVPMLIGLLLYRRKVAC